MPKVDRMISVDIDRMWGVSVWVGKRCLWAKKRGVHKMLFSERNGYTKGVDVLGWRVFYKKVDG